MLKIYLEPNYPEYYGKIIHSENIDGYNVIITHIIFKKQLGEIPMNEDMMENGFLTAHIEIPEDDYDNIDISPDIDFDLELDCNKYVDGKYYWRFSCLPDPTNEKTKDFSFEKCNIDFCVDKCRCLINQMIKK